MAFNVRFMLVIVLLTVSVVRTSAECKVNVDTSMVDESNVADCEKALWFDENTSKCLKVDPSQSTGSGALGVITEVDDPSECTVFYLIPARQELFLAFKVGTDFKSVNFQFSSITVTDLIYSIQLTDGPNSPNVDPLAGDNYLTTLTFKYLNIWCICLLDDGSVGSLTHQTIPEVNPCGDVNRCGSRWRFRLLDEICGTPPDVENGDKAVDCIYEGCNTTYVCDDQYEIEGNAISQCVGGTWTASPTCAPGDPCQNNPCQNGGTCENVGGVAVCMCAAGVTGTNCETDCNVAVDEKCEKKGRRKKACNRRKCLFKYGCDPELEEACGDNGQCVETNDAFRCQCSENFIGGKCQIDVQECIANRTAACETYCNGKVYKRCRKGARGSRWNSISYWRQQAACSRKLRGQKPCKQCISRCVAIAKKKCNNPRCFYNKQKWARFSNKKYGWGCVKKNRTYWGFVRWLPRRRC